MQQSLLDQVAHARHSDPETSHLAAGVASNRLTETQERILSILTIQGPKTDEQITTAYRDYWPESRVTEQSLRSRRSELVTNGKVRFTGEYGLTSHAGKTRIWEAV